MRRIIFVNQEWSQEKWIIPTIKYLLMFAVVAVLSIILFLCGKSAVMGGVVGACNFIVIPLLNIELRERFLIDVDESLEQTENGICIGIPKIRRGNELTEHAEWFIWDRERVQRVLIHTYSDIVDIVGHPVIHTLQDGKEKVGDTYEMQPEKYVTFQIHCTEENRDEILELLQEGLHREMDREAN